MRNSIVKILIASLHTCNQLDNVKVRQIGEMFNFDCKKYCSDFGITYNIIKDNPVPSLDHELAKKYANSVDCNRDRYLSIHAFIRWCNEKYGVETDNEQPKESLCIGGKTKKECQCGVFTDCPYRR